MVIAVLFLSSNITLHDATAIRCIAIQVNHAVVDGNYAVRVCIATMLLQKRVPTVQVATIEQGRPTDVNLKVSTVDSFATRFSGLLTHGATNIRLRVSAPCGHDQTWQSAYDDRNG